MKRLLWLVPFLMVAFAVGDTTNVVVSIQIERDNGSSYRQAVPLYGWQFFPDTTNGYNRLCASSVCGTLNSSEIGIGTNAPASMLHIHKDSPTAAQILFTISTSDDSQRFYVDEDGSCYMDYILYVPTEIRACLIKAYASSEDLELTTSDATGGHDIYLTKTAGGTQLARFTGDGYAAIGTNSNPTVPLTVGPTNAAGLIVILEQCPTADPSVTGALWASNGILRVSGY